MEAKRDERQHPRQVRMTDEFHSAAVARALANKEKFGVYVRRLIATDMERSARKGARRG